MGVQQDELDEVQEMLGVGAIHQKLALLSDSHALENMYQAGLEQEIELIAIKAVRGLYKDRYECLKSLCRIGLRNDERNRCELQGWLSVTVEKDCATVDEAVDLVLEGKLE